MSDLIASRTIPCRRCGHIGETYRTVRGWYCEKCMKEIAQE